MTRTQNPLSRYCPRLGGPVAFAYCLQGEMKSPCFKVLDCWWETFDIVRYLKDHLSDDQFERLMNVRIQSKMSSLVEAIEQAKRRIHG